MSLNCWTIIDHTRRFCNFPTFCFMNRSYEQRWRSQKEVLGQNGIIWVTRNFRCCFIVWRPKARLAEVARAPTTKVNSRWFVFMLICFWKLELVVQEFFLMTLESFHHTKRSWQGSVKICMTVESKLVQRSIIKEEKKKLLSSQPSSLEITLDSWRVRSD